MKVEYEKAETVSSTVLMDFYLWSFRFIRKLEDGIKVVRRTNDAVENNFQLWPLFWRSRVFVYDIFIFTSSRS